MTSSAGPRPPRSLIHLLLVGWMAAALFLGLLGTTPATAATKTPPVPSGLPSQIEGFASYVPANSCSTTKRAGTAKLGQLLTTTYPNTIYYASRVCGVLPNSEHHDGRAVDWMNNIRNPTQAAQAKAVLSWLFATDAKGNTYANVRRLGVMYVIWNNKIWSAYSADQGWRDYSSCKTHPEPGWDNTCHRNHMHLSLSWNGATGQVSFWTKKVTAPDYGRCRPADLNWSYPYQSPNAKPCPRYGKVSAAPKASTLSKALTNYSGRYLYMGNSGDPVRVVQQAVRAKVDGNFGPATKTAVQNWQRSHGLYVTGTINHDTWRALMKANAPKASSPSQGARLSPELDALDAMPDPD